MNEEPMKQETNDPEHKEHDVQDDAAAAGSKEDTKDAAELLEGWKRALADYENLQRRVSEERRQSFEQGMETALMNMARLVGYLDLAMTHVPAETPENMKDFIEGIRHIQREFHQMIDAEGLRLIAPAEGKEMFDPERHEAVGRTPSDFSDGIIVKVLSMGYMRGTRVLRPARVSISSGPKEREKRNL